MKRRFLLLVPCLLLSACDRPAESLATSLPEQSTAGWRIDFLDNFDSFDPENWQDQILWVNDEDHCYVRDGEHNTRRGQQRHFETKGRDLGEKRPCDNLNKKGEQHPETQYVAGRITSKNRKEFIKGRWTARLRVENSGEPGMFPAWWLLGAYNNEPPVQEEDETGVLACDRIAVKSIFSNITAMAVRIITQRARSRASATAAGETGSN